MPPGSDEAGNRRKERLNGENMKATLRKMGIDFLNSENGSDVGNYRVRAEFIDRDGLHVIADFGGYDRIEVYEKKNGKADCRIAQKNALHIDGSYRDDEGNCWNYAAKLHNDGFDFAKYRFTISGILAFLSDVTGENYTEIEFYD